MLRGVGVGIAGGRLGRRLGRAARQRKFRAIVQGANAVLVEAGFFNLQVRAVQRIRRQFLDRKTHRFSGGVETALRKTRTFLLADRGGEQFGAGLIAECGHGG